MIRVQQEDFDVGQEIKSLRGNDTGIGGICTFIGTVRELTSDKAISSMTLEHYPGMTEKALGDIEIEANARWSLSGSLIIHRYGKLEPGDQIVLVVTASPHREAAFEACQFLMDWLKTKAPFWKLEENKSGDHGWVDANSSDDVAANRWNEAKNKG
jgi:molybdopterin synthase catalytic subunit